MAPGKKRRVRPTALITGGSGGIGLELAKVFGEHGHDMVLVARYRDSLEAAAGHIEGKYGVKVSVIPSDLRHPESPERIFNALRDQQIEIGCLVNNAGFGLGGPFLETDLERELDMIQVNVAAVVQLTKLFLPGMVRAGAGRIMNVASTAAFQPGPLMSVYYATKAFVLSFSEALAEELRNSGVSVTALCPGATATAFAETAETSNTRIFTRLGVAHPAPVARYGYKTMMRGRTVAIPGVRDRLMIQAERLAPRSVVTRLARLVQENR